MKVALIGRSSLYSVTGGDTIQMVKTADALQKLNIEAEILLASDTINYARYDLLHFFNLLRPADHLAHIRKSKRPYVLSTIYLEYMLFDRYGRSYPYRLLFRAMGKNGSEYFKNLYRYARKQDKLASPGYLLGHKRAMKKILEGASVILPNSGSEYRRIVADTDFSGRHIIVPNGIDPERFGTIPGSVKREDKVLCVAQIYGMKNQHRLIEACRKLKMPLEIIGKAPPNHSGYYRYCRQIAGPNVSFIDFLLQEQLIPYYASAKVHALPSWFETTGLSSMEAGAMGCNIVAGKEGDAYDYFGDHAWYCDAQDQESIERALEKAMGHENKLELRELILSEYTWQKAAEKTKEAYYLAMNG